MVVMQQTRVARRSPTLPVAAPSVLSIFIVIGLLLLHSLLFCMGVKLDR